MDLLVNFQKINQAVKPAENILLVIHQQPDADALGSLVAFSGWLDILGKRYTSFCREVPVTTDNLAFLINPKLLETTPEVLFAQKYDLVIIFDSGDLKYAGMKDILPRLSPTPLVINIDHHITNDNFGDINLTNPQAVSTTEIIYQFFHFSKIKISPKMATAILAGIIFDTYNFTNPNTSYFSLEVASKMLLAGANLPQVSDSILKNKTIEVLKLWGKILTRLTRHPRLNIISTIITLEDLPDPEENIKIIEGIANFLNSLDGTKAVLIISQQEKDLIKGSLRTNSDLIDVAKLATILGGGGHRKAAGFKIKGRLVETKNGQWQII